MASSGVLKQALFGGFDKKSVDGYLQKQLAYLNKLETQAGQPLTTLQPQLLKKTRIGSGYDKESVLTYVETIQQKIIMLEENLKIL